MAWGQFSPASQSRYSRSALSLRAPWGCTTIARRLVWASDDATNGYDR